MFIVDIRQLQSSNNTWNTWNTCFWHFSKTEKFVWRDFSWEISKKTYALFSDLLPFWIKAERKKSMYNTKNTAIITLII